MMESRKFDLTEEALVRELYGRVEKCVDSLPYSPEFDTMYKEFCGAADRNWTENEFFVAMTSLRKRKGGLKKPR